VKKSTAFDTMLLAYDNVLDYFKRTLRIINCRCLLAMRFVFPKNRQTQIATAPLNGQVRLYEETVNALQEEILKEMVTLLQMQKIQLLPRIQFGQILNSELTSPFEND